MKNKILPVILLFNILIFFNACDLLDLLGLNNTLDQSTSDQSNGLTGAYFSGTNLSGPAFERVDKTSFIYVVVNDERAIMMVQPILERVCKSINSLLKKS